MSLDHIQKREIFEDLCRAFLNFEYKTDMYTFSKEGKDQGIDSIRFVPEENKYSVYQFKFHNIQEQRQAATQLKSDINQEFKKISTYLKDAESRWHTVNKWVLMTNVKTNPKISAEILAHARLKAQECNLSFAIEVWEASKIDSLILKHPDLDRRHKNNPLPNFTSLSNIYEDRLPLYSDLNEYIDSPGHLNKIEKFLTLLNEQVFIIFAESCVGKTRLLIEAGKSSEKLGRKVYWGKIETMQKNSDWVKGFCSNCTLLLDEPSIEILKILLEQLHFEKNDTLIRSLKIVIVLDKTKKEEIDFIAEPNNQNICHSLTELLPPNQHDSHKIAQELVNKANLEDPSSASKLTKNYCGYPLWMVMEINYIQKNTSVRYNLI